MGKLISGTNKQSLIMTWYKKYLSVYEKPLQEAPQEVIQEIKTKINKLQSDTPLVSVVVIAYNEEKHLLANLWSLSDSVCKYPIEIIGVDNDSKDRTAEIFKMTSVPYFTEYQHSCGYARRCGLNHARGKYYICIDSDTMYPPKYVETLVKVLEKPGIVAVSSLWSYIPDKQHPWLGVKIYEFIRDSYLFLQSFKRPELSVRGLVFAYNIEYGKIHFLHTRKARAVTGYGTVGNDGSFFNSFKVRAIKAFKNIETLFTKKEGYEDEESNLIK